MTFVPKPNTGSLWANDRKTSENHPDLRGEVVIDRKLLADLMAKGENPVKIALAGWNKTTVNGRDYVSLVASEPFVPQKRVEQEHPKVEDDDQDIPF
jgi:uncharacterized protein (DUF736 family)